jgi:hypothetical protein
VQKAAGEVGPLDGTGVGAAVCTAVGPAVGVGARLGHGVKEADSVASGVGVAGAWVATGVGV